MCWGCLATSTAHGTPGLVSDWSQAGRVTCDRRFIDWRLANQNEWTPHSSRWINSLTGRPGKRLAAAGEWFRGTPDEMMKVSRQGLGGRGMETQFTSEQYRLSCGRPDRCGEASTCEGNFGRDIPLSNSSLSSSGVGQKHPNLRMCLLLPTILAQPQPVGFCVTEIRWFLSRLCKA